MFAEQAKALAEGGVDFLIIETMMDVNEALIALSAAQVDGASRLCDDLVCKKPRGYFTIMGNKPADAARALVDGRGRGGGDKLLASHR